MKSRIQPYLFSILLVFLAIGYFYPIIGSLAIVCMLAPVLLAPFKGRYWCGNYCPRGSFYDTIISKFSPQKSIPPLLRSSVFRIFILVLIMTIFTIQMYFAWGDWAEIGLVFIRVIFITTVIGIILGVIYHQRTWCSFCPMGTMASWFSAKAKPLVVSDSCVNCKICTKVCPFELEPNTAKGTDAGFVHKDCLKCNRCVEKCPKQSLSFTPRE